MPDSKQFETIFEHANEAIVISDDKGNIWRVNPSAVNLFGYTNEELEGRRIEVLIPKRYHTSHEKHVGHFHSKPKNRKMGEGMGLFAAKKDGEEFPVEVSLSPCILRNRRMVVAFIIDITERKKVEEQSQHYQKKLEQEVEDRTLVLKEAISNLENTKKKLDASLQKERELNSLKSKFVSTASHEFRTPLATIMSSLSLVEKYGEIGQKEKGEKHIERIKKSVRNLTEILDDILSVNKIEEGKIVLNPQEFDIIPFIKDLVYEAQLIAKKGQRINFKYKGIKDLNVHQDGKLLRHILLNLLSNAIKFSNDNITLSLAERKKTLRISVKDSGIGIPESDLSNLFDRFFRAENVEQIQGTGLGLSIVEQYVHLLDGSVSCKSEENKGSMFTIKIPKKI